MKYFVKLGADEHEVVLDGDNVTIDGETLRAHVEDLAGTPISIVTIGSQVHRVIARRGAQRGQYIIDHAGRRFAVEALDERSRAIRQLGGAARAAGPAHLVAPMPGLIVRVNVAAGDQVSAGKGLVVMEAMKMENELRAATAGTVARVLVEPGKTVEKGTTLIEMEGEKRDS